MCQLYISVLGSREMRVRSAKDFRLSYDRLRYVMKALLLLSQAGRAPSEGVHRATDVERVECSADLLEVKCARMSSKSSPWSTGRDTLELLTTAENATSRRVSGTGLHPRLDRSDQQSTRRELAQDVVGLGQ